MLGPCLFVALDGGNRYTTGDQIMIPGRRVLTRASHLGRSNVKFAQHKIGEEWSEPYRTAQ